MKKVLITGASGFVGSFLAEELAKSSEYSLFGTCISEGSQENLSDIKDKIQLEVLDLANHNATVTLLEKIKPDIVYHLAAIATTVDSFANPAGIITNNVSVELSILEGLRLHQPKARVLVISSAEVYGCVTPEDLPIDEETPLRPANPYAVSKIAQDFLGLQYYYAYKMDVVRIRPFNHIGPRQSPNFAVSSFARQIAQIEKSKHEGVIKVGNLTSKRDFTDVRDVVKGYVLLAEKGIASDVYNIGSGNSYLMTDVLNKLLSLSTAKITIEQDSKLMRPQDVAELACDHTKITNLTGWNPQIPLDQSLQDILEYWRGQ